MRRRRLLFVGFIWVVLPFILALVIFIVVYRHLHASRANQPLSQAGSTTHIVTVDGEQRTFRLYRPASLPVDKPAPLVVMLHGALGSGKQAEKSYKWNAEADKGKFVVAYPDGYRHTWNVSSDCCGPAVKKQINDVGFIIQMIDAIGGSISIDRSRIYATGISNGGALAYRLACNTNIFAAIGPDSSTLLGDCPSPSPTSVLHIHGLADNTFPYNGGTGKRNGAGDSQTTNTVGPAIPDLINTWRTIDSCSGSITTNEGVVSTAISQCVSGRTVELITIAGAGHQWPGAIADSKADQRLIKLDPPSTALDATSIFWKFFSEHAKPAT
jgi:polyhydroxybutyrate depolymerase